MLCYFVIVFFIFFFFFFSSRRRHTRFDCDWSSDVCSSDLYAPQPRRADPGAARRGCGAYGQVGAAAHGGRGADGGRSEERRVGKGVDLGGRRIIKKKRKKKEDEIETE